MVSFNVYKSTASGAYVEGVCLATDEKPVVGIANGSILFAVDTTSGETTRYMYDQNSMSWIEATLPGGSGGSGGGGGSGGEGQLVVHLDENHIADKTFGEIEAALQSGQGAMVEMSGLYGGVCDCHNVGDGYKAAFFAVSVPPNGQAPKLLGMRSSNTNAAASDYPDFNSGGGGQS